MGVMSITGLLTGLLPLGLAALGVQLVLPPEKATGRLTDALVLLLLSVGQSSRWNRVGSGEGSASRGIGRDDRRRGQGRGCNGGDPLDSHYFGGRVSNGRHQTLQIICTMCCGGSETMDRGVLWGVDVGAPG